MTEEQIEQRAERYAETYVSKTAAYIGGAHAEAYAIDEGTIIADGEVEMLQNQIEELSEQLKMNAENIQKLRNPWISVEEGLPKRESEKASWSVYVFIRTCYNSHEEAKYDTVNGIWYDKHKQVINDPITHWMPIPQLKGE